MVYFQRFLELSQVQQMKKSTYILLISGSLAISVYPNPGKLLPTWTKNLKWKITNSQICKQGHESD